MTLNPNEQAVTALVENKAGVLARFIGLFARRGFNINALAVAPTEDERFSRITFIYDIGSAPVDQMLAQVSKLINVIEVRAIDHATDDHQLLIDTLNSKTAAFQ